MRASILAPPARTRRRDGATAGRLSGAIGLTLVLLLLVPLASADHVFSHRIYIVGRVVDAQGLSAPGLPVELRFENLSANSKCFDAKEEKTGPKGDFEICRHAHAIEGEPRVNVTVGGASRTVGIDPDLRGATVALQLPGPAPARDLTGDRQFNRTFLVAGRHFELMPEPAKVEGVLVSAVPVIDNVTIRLLDGERVLNMTTVPTDEMGRFSVELPIEALPPGAIVTAASGPAFAEESASALFRRADLNVVHDLRLIRGPGDDAPGGDVPAAWGIAVAAVVIGAFSRRALGRVR